MYSSSCTPLGATNTPTQNYVHSSDHWAIGSWEVLLAGPGSKLSRQYFKRTNRFVTIWCSTTQKGSFREDM